MIGHDLFVRQINGLYFQTFQIFKSLTPKELIQLAQHITPQNMRTLAIEYLDFKPPEVDNFEFSRPGDPSAFKFDILYNWTCRSHNNNREVLITTHKQSYRKVMCSQAYMSLHGGGDCITRATLDLTV